MKNYKKNLSPLFIFLLLGAWTNFANADDGPVACTGSGTAASPITDTGDALSCLTEPDIYKVKMYEMGLCTAAPTLANMATACTSVSKIPAGGLVTVANGVNSAIPGTFTRPNNGTYAYGYMILAPEFRITATKTFAANKTGKGGEGKTCWTLAGTFRDSGSEASYDGGGALTKIEAGENDTWMATCGSAAAAAPGESVTVQDSFGGGDIGVNGDASVSMVVDGATVAAHLTDSDLVLATASANVTRLVSFVTFATPATVTDDSTTFTTSFKVSQGSMFGYEEVNGSDSIKYIGSGPFVTKLSVE